MRWLGARSYSTCASLEFPATRASTAPASVIFDQRRTHLGYLSVHPGHGSDHDQRLRTVTESAGSDAAINGRSTGPAWATARYSPSFASNVARLVEGSLADLPP